jgi:NADH-quinone oxidoreductase subunit L
LNLPFTHGTKLLENWLEPVVGSFDLPHGATIWTLVVIAVVVAIVGILAGIGVYVQHRVASEAVEQDVFAHGWYIDETYAAVAGGPGRRAFDAMAWFDRNVIDGAVNGAAWLAGQAGQLIRRLQSGQMRGYALGMACGAVLMLAYVALRMGF